jgi:DNA helicase II / ATP-dependent DNA helicase PcrA
VIAGAGSGKTNTLAHRVAHLIVKGADPRRILLMTFSRRAASEMTKRVERIARKVMGDNAGVMTDALAWSGTFHGMGARLLRDYSDQIGLDPQFTIHDREDSADLMNLIRHEKGFSKTERRFPTKGTCLSIYSRCVNAETAIEQVLGASFPWCSGWAAELKELFAAYVEAKQKQNVLDYDDLLLYWAQTMSDPALADEVGGRFDHVLVDEYQDTNRLQSSILLALKPGGHGLTVVGDDAQSIYSFRAATVRNILDFPTQFSPPASIITLDRNYRSTQTILAAANGVIDLAKERFTWPGIAALYAELMTVMPSPIIELNRAVAVSRVEGPEAGLAIVDRLLDEPALKDYHLLPNVRGDLLHKLGRHDEARAAFEAAAGLAGNKREQDFLKRRAAEAAQAVTSSP